MGNYSVNWESGQPTSVQHGPGAIPVTKTVDVVVAGGGTAGFVAAISAARNGAKTLLIERYGFLGGTMTGALICTPGEYHDAEGERVVGGIPWEMTQHLADMGAGILPYPFVPLGSGTGAAPFDPEVYQVVAAEKVQRAGAQQLFHTWVSDAIVVEGSMRGVVIENKSGRQAVLAKVVIDATGDADVAARAGALCAVGRPEDGRTASMTMMFRLGNLNLGRLIEYMQKNPDDLILTESPHMPKPDLSTLDQIPWIAAGGFFKLIQRAKEHGDYAGRDRVVFFCMPYRKTEVIVNTADVSLNGADGEEFSQAELEGRRQVLRLVRFFKKYVPGFEDSYLIDMATQIGVRESRRVIGDYTLTKEDVLECRRFADGVGRGAYAVNYHLEGKTIHIFPKRYYGLPYGLILSKGPEGLLVAGRCASATHEGEAALRGILNCMVLGEAAGAAGALAARRGITPRQLPIAELQETLRRQGVLI